MDEVDKLHLEKDQTTQLSSSYTFLNTKMHSLQRICLLLHINSQKPVNWRKVEKKSRVVD